MSKGIRKFFQRGIDARNRTTRPGAVQDLGSSAVTGIAPGDAGSNRSVSKKRPGRRNADTPLGPRGRGRL
jgi:hypothetical protein